MRIVRTLEYVLGKAYFKEPKTKHARRTINLHDGTVALLLEHKQRGMMPGELVFSTLSGEPFYTNNVLNRYFKPCLLAAGLATLGTTAKGTKRIVSKFRMYDLRHTHATMLLEANVNPKIVSERLGHASVSLTLDTYSPHPADHSERRSRGAWGIALQSFQHPCPDTPELVGTQAAHEIEKARSGAY